MLGTVSYVCPLIFLLTQVSHQSCVLELFQAHVCQIFMPASVSQASLQLCVMFLELFHMHILLTFMLAMVSHAFPFRVMCLESFHMHVRIIFMLARV